MTWPMFPDELAALGYQPPPVSAPMPCSACGTPMWFWRTPNGKQMPLSSAGLILGKLHPHFTDCPEAGRFKRGK